MRLQRISSKGLLCRFHAPYFCIGSNLFHCRFGVTYVKSMSVNIMTNK
jgi:hypothetical protein